VNAEIVHLKSASLQRLIARCGRVYQDLTLSWSRMPKRIMVSSAVLRNLQQPRFRSDMFRILAAAGQFPTLASSSGRDYKA